MQWSVDVRAAKLAPNVQLDFREPEIVGQPTPPLSAGDTLTLDFPINDRASGKVLEANTTSSLIEVSAAHWRIRRARAGDDLIPPGSPQPTAVWLIENHLPSN
jgi:hypothetical protein